METIETQGIALPRLGLGTFRLEGGACREAVESALALGYRHIDTAEMYGNEAEIGDALANAAVAREELVVTTKVWHDHLAPAGIARALEASLARLRLAYVDLFLVHWPAPGIKLPEVLETMMRLSEAGLARAIGVCNFTVPLLKEAIETIGAPIACNQIEYHVFLDQTPVRSYLAEKGIPLVAYAPLGQGRLAETPELQAIGRKHGASAAQVALAWLFGQKGVAAIPKAGRRTSQQANLDALAIRLDEEDRRVIKSLPKARRLVNPSFSPRWDP